MRALKFSAGGLRGRVETGSLIQKCMTPLASAVGRWAKHDVVLLARDGRSSSEKVYAWVLEGLLSEGCDVLDLGVMPTPMLAWAAAFKNVPGLMITGSHNSEDVSGLKIFNNHGYALSAQEADAITQNMYVDALKRKQGQHSFVCYAKEYCAQLPSICLTADMMLDCAHGACASLMPFLKGNPTVCAVQGKANDGVGVMHPHFLQQCVLDRQASVGFAFDADGDRVVACDHTGRICSAEDLTALLAIHLGCSHVVVSALANTGLVLFLQSKGVAVTRAPVGDAHVAETMRCVGAQLGMEPSGHMLLDTFVGDGLKTMLTVLDIMHKTGQSLQKLLPLWSAYPSWLKAFDYETRPSHAKLDALQSALQERLPNGRSVVRLSRTSASISIYIEEQDPQALRTAADFAVRACAASTPLYNPESSPR